MKTKNVVSKKELRAQILVLENDAYRLRGERDSMNKTIEEQRKTNHYLEQQVSNGSGYIRGIMDTLAAFGHVIPHTEGYR